MLGIIWREFGLKRASDRTNVGKRRGVFLPVNVLQTDFGVLTHFRLNYLHPVDFKHI